MRSDAIVTVSIGFQNPAQMRLAQDNDDRGRDRSLLSAPRTTPYVQLSRIRRPPRVGDGKSLIGPGVQDSRLWEEVIGKLRNPLPVRLILLAASA